MKQKYDEVLTTGQGGLFIDFTKTKIKKLLPYRLFINQISSVSGSVLPYLDDLPAS